MVTSLRTVRDMKKMQYYSKGIRKFQKELGLKVKIFPNLHIWPIDGDTKDEYSSRIEVRDDLGYESAAQRTWRERMKEYYQKISLCLIRSDQSNPTFGERNIM